MSFLNAEWRMLAIANYEIAPELLQAYLPSSTELDFWNGKCFVSLVGFMFMHTKLLGVPIPFHRTFEEVNLRFYVRHKQGKEWRRGVVFVKEIVPKAAITFVANTIYKEHYETLPMSHEWLISNEHLTVKYNWHKNNEVQTLLVKSEKIALEIELGSITEFITEHYWGYTQNPNGKNYEYEVTHPKWLHYPVKAYEIDVNFGELYGNQFDFLAMQTPHSVMLAQGSEITVESKRLIKN